MSRISSLKRARLVPVFLGLFVLAATAALELGVVGSNAANTAVSQTMHAAVHQNNDILLTFDDGSAVGSQDRATPTIPAGTYTVRVVDDTDEHNFHIVGPGVDMSTSTGGSASPTWTVTFQNGGLYRFVCDNHPDFMYGLFQASAAAGGGSTGGSAGGGSSGGSSGSSSGGSSGGASGGSSASGGSGASSGSKAVLATLSGTVGATGKLTLKVKGRAVKKLAAGRYKITVTDKTAARSFAVQQAKHKAIVLSSVPFVGSKTVTLTLRAGKWSFLTTAGKKSTTAFTVA